MIDWEDHIEKILKHDDESGVEVLYRGEPAQFEFISSALRLSNQQKFHGLRTRKELIREFEQVAAELNSMYKLEVALDSEVVDTPILGNLINKPYSPIH